MPFVLIAAIVAGSVSADARATGPVPGPCCTGCAAGLAKYFSIPANSAQCGECCIEPSKYPFWKVFEPALLPGNCSSQNYTVYVDTERDGVGPLSIDNDRYIKPNGSAAVRRPAHPAAPFGAAAPATAPLRRLAPPLPGGPLAPYQPCDPPRPHFSWDVIPTSYHGARKDAVFSDAEVARLAKYQVMAVEKWYTPCGSKGPTMSGPDCAVEEKIEHLFGRTRAISPNQTTVLYWNNMLDFSFYKAHAAMEALEAQGLHAYLRDETGAIIYLCNDGNVYCNMTTFDWTQPHVRALWIQAVTNATASGLVDGIYADHSAEKGIGIGSNFNFTSHAGVVTPYTKNNQGPNQLCNGKGSARSCYNFTESFAASFNSWHAWSTNYTQQLLSSTTGGPVIAGPWANMGTWAGTCTFDGIREAQASSGLTMLEIQCGCIPPADKIIQFLAAAQEFNYMHCMGNYGEGTLVQNTSFPEMAYSLGAPLGPAAEVPSSGSGVWRRAFASGAWVLWDNNKHNGTYHFPGNPPSPPPPPSPPSPSPSPPSPPLPPGPSPSSKCGKLLVDTGVAGKSIKAHNSNQPSASACCSKCASVKKCSVWAWHGDAAGLCRLHAKGATTHAGTVGLYAGRMNYTGKVE